MKYSVRIRKGMRYYHKDCVPQLIPTLNLEPRYRKRKFSEAWPEIELQRLRKVRIERRDLREGLQKWRLKQAKLEHRVMEPFKVFVEATLDALVDEMPDTNEKLMRCYGIGRKRAKKYGSALLQLIRTYKETHGYTYSTSSVPTPNSEASNNRASDEKDHHVFTTGRDMYIPASPIAMDTNANESEPSQSYIVRITNDPNQHVPSMTECEKLQQKVSNMSVTCSTDLRLQSKANSFY